MSEEMKPCPFCNERKISTNYELSQATDDALYFCWCINCNSRGPSRTTENKAIIAWNERKRD